MSNLQKPFKNEIFLRINFEGNNLKYFLCRRNWESMTIPEYVHVRAF